MGSSAAPAPLARRCPGQVPACKSVSLFALIRLLCCFLFAPSSGLPIFNCIFPQQLGYLLYILYSSSSVSVFNCCVPTTSKLNDLKQLLFAQDADSRRGRPACSGCARGSEGWAASQGHALGARPGSLLSPGLLRAASLGFLAAGWFRVPRGSAAKDKPQCASLCLLMYPWPKQVTNQKQSLGQEAMNIGRCSSLGALQ